MGPISIAMALAQFAPAAIKWLTGSDKAEEAAQAVIGVAQQVAGSSDPVEALAAITGNAQLQIEFRKALMANESDLDKAFLQDRQDARARDAKFIEGGRRNVRADVMVAADAIGLIVCLVVLAVYRDNLPGEAIALISTIASIFGLCLRDAHQFEFGSSRSSRDKDGTISDMLRR